MIDPGRDPGEQSTRPVVAVMTDVCTRAIVGWNMS